MLGLGGQSCICFCGGCAQRPTLGPCCALQVRVAALQNLVKIMSLYYQYMETYMGPALFAVSTGTSCTEAPELHLRCFAFVWEGIFAYILALFFSGCVPVLSKLPKAIAETPKRGAAQVLGLLSSPAWVADGRSCCGS